MRRLALAMKKIILLFIFFVPIFSSAQIVAGLSPSGAHIVYPNDSITVFNAGDRDSLHLDLDCDNNSDILLILKKGAPAIDAGHTLEAYMLDTTYEFCIRQTLGPKVRWFDFGDTMFCDSTNFWQYINKDLNPNMNHNILQAGGFGGFPPLSGTDTFFMVRRKLGVASYQEGWISLSFETLSVSNPYVVLESYTKFCAPNATEKMSKLNGIKVYPTIVDDRFIIDVGNLNESFDVQIVDSRGRTLMIKKEMSGLRKNSFDAVNYPPGIYFVKVNVEGQTKHFKLLKR